MARQDSAELLVLHTAATNDVTTGARLRKAGMSSSTIAARCRPGGPWRRLLPGVILLNRAEPTRRQQLLAATYYAGTDAVVTGVDALQACGLALPTPRDVHILLPPGRRMLPREFVSFERTTRVPVPIWHGEVPLAPPARATIDAARQESDSDRLRRILCLPVYHGLCTVEELRTEVDCGNQRGTAAVRQMLRDLGSLKETYRHGTARELLRRMPLPMPAWNMTICDLQGHPIGAVDAWWDEIALGWQFGGSVTGSGPTMNHLALVAAGVVLVRSTPDQLFAQTERTARELISAFASAAKRRRPKVLAFGATAA
jgi:hypothetical protein